MRVAVFVAAAAPVAAVQGNPIAKVLELLAGMRSKIVAEGESEQKSYEEFAHWCRTESKSLKREVADASEDVREIQAAISKANANIESLTSSIGDLAAGQQKAEKELAEATEVRSKEHADYSKVVAELSVDIAELQNSYAVMERKLGKASFAQVVKKSEAVQDVMQGLSAVVDASSVDYSDAKKLQALLQSGDQDTMQNDGILETVAGMLSKAEEQKARADKAEMQNEHDFMTLKASLKDQMSTMANEQEQHKKEKAANEEKLATATGDLVEAQKELAEDSASLNDVHSNCEEQSHAWDVSMQSRAHEIEALDAATKILESKTTGAAQKRAGYSFVQLSTSKSSVFGDVVASLVQTGKESQDRKLAMLAMRVRSLASSSADPFGKIKGLIEDMIAKLEQEAAEEASAKAFCDSETAKAKAKKDEHDSTISVLSSKLDSAKARITKLKEQVATLTNELSDIAENQAVATGIRKEEADEFLVVEKDYEDGLDGVQMALKVLRDYYAQAFVQVDQPATPGSHSANSGGASSIIGILEVAESDFGKLLAEARDGEQSAIASFEQLTEDNKIATTTKKVEVKHKNEEITELKHTVSEHSNDRESEQEELDSVIEYLSKLGDQCVAKPEPYEERKRRREQEMDGLKNALDILEGQAIGFLAVKSHTHRM
jgi:chromosome segregation ATPase